MEKALYKLFYEVEDTHWWFVATRQHALNLLGRYLPKRRPTILDAGCGTGGIMKLLSGIGIIHGIDVSEDALFYTRKRGLKNVTLGSITKLPYQEKQFDAVLALDVIEHIKDDARALDELARVLKPTGVLIALVPAFRFLWSNHDTINHHYHRYTKEEIAQRIKDAGLVVLDTYYFGFTTFLPLLIKSVLEKAVHFPMQFNVARRLPNTINTILLKIYSVDLAISERFLFPCGTSIIIVARRTTPVTHLRRGHNWTPRNTTS